MTCDGRLNHWRNRSKSPLDINPGLWGFLLHFPGNLDVFFALWLHMTLRAALGDREDICPQLRPDSVQIRPLNQPPPKSHARACAAAAHALTAAARLTSSLTSMTLCLPTPPPPPSCNTHVCTGSHAGMQHKLLRNFFPAVAAQQLS